MVYVTYKKWSKTAILPVEYHFYSITMMSDAKEFALTCSKNVKNIRFYPRDAENEEQSHSERYSSPFRSTPFRSYN